MGKWKKAKGMCALAFMACLMAACGKGTEEIENPDAITDGTENGNTDGTADGTKDGNADGTTDGTENGNADGIADGTDGNTDETEKGKPEGTPGAQDEKEGLEEFLPKIDLPELCLVEKQNAGNPIITHIFTADPSAHVWEDGKIYIYASHDMDPAQGCDFMDRYHVFSSWDMANWVDEGEILSSDDVEWGRPEGGFMWAPDCAYRDGKYYFYYPHPSDSRWNDSWKVGVAVSDNPCKDFVDQGYIEGIGGDSMIDPCVFEDEDGRFYLYYGGGGHCLGGELGDDMISMKEEMRPMEGLVDFHEGTWVFKRNGIYYLTYADNHNYANQMRYAVSSNPLGPWTYQGVFLEPTGCDTTHGSVVEYEGEWYLFYHNQRISGAGNLRSVCVDKLEFDENGAIKMVTQTGAGISSIRSEQENVGITERYQSVTGYDVRGCTVSGGAKITAKPDDPSKEAAVYNLHQEGAECTFEGIDGGEGGRAVIYIHYASNAQWVKLKVYVNGEDLSFVNAKGNGSWDKYSGVTQVTVELMPGKNNTITLSGGNGGINVDGIVVAIVKE